jgi:rRNA maturation endonuclease Nob1
MRCFKCNCNGDVESIMIGIKVKDDWKYYRRYICQKCKKTFTRNALKKEVPIEWK